MSLNHVSRASLISLVATAAANLLLAAPVLAQPVETGDAASATAPAVPGPAETPASAPAPVPPVAAAPQPAAAQPVAPAEPSRPPALVPVASAEDPDPAVGGGAGSDFTMMSSLAIRLVRRGGLLQKKEGGGFSFANASLLYRSGIFGIGGFADATFLTGELYSGGGMAGLALRSGGGFRADLLGTAGVRYYHAWDEGLGVRHMAADITGQSDLGPGSATLPFAGVRAHVGYIFGRGRGGHFNLGAMTSLDWDLWRNHRPTQTIGGTNLVIGLTLGATIDLGR